MEEGHLWLRITMVHGAWFTVHGYFFFTFSFNVLTIDVRIFRILSVATRQRSCKHVSALAVPSVQYGIDIGLRSKK